MAKQSKRLTTKELELMEAMRRQPELMERFAAILALSEGAADRVERADEVEAGLVEQLRELGARSMEQWARGAEARSARHYQRSHRSGYAGKKKR